MQCSNAVVYLTHFICVVSTAGLMRDLWVNDKRVRKWVLPRRSINGDSEGVQEMGFGHFQKKYNKIQVLIQQIGCMDELLSGNAYFIKTPPH